MSLAISPMTPAEWPAVHDIYEAGIATGHATFETRVPQWQEWDATHLAAGRLVGRLGGRIVGWAALAPVSRRTVYRGVAEVSVYVDPESSGNGFGGTLLGALVEASERAGVWTLQASIFPENEASVALHHSHGFREVGIRERIAVHHGVWRDVVLMERRSPVVGAEPSPG